MAKRRRTPQRGKKDMPERTNEKKFRKYDDRRDESSNSGRNDVSWYTRYPNLSIATAQFPFPYRPGMNINLGTPTQKVEMTIPGVMEMRWYPSLGWSETATDPASIVCKELFAHVRKAYGAGDLLADAPDFMVYLMALDGVFSFLASMRRVFRVLTAWSPDNYITPDGLLLAMGCSNATVQNLRVNRSQFWQVINELTLMSRKFTCPAVMDIMNRHFWMNDNVYTDSETINSQMYVFHQMGYYMYSSQNMPSGDPAAGLTISPTPFDSTKTITVQDIYAFGRNLIDALVAWDDAYTINGYLSRAFDGTPNFIVDETPLDQSFNPVYSEEVLSQIENSRPIWGGTINVTSLNVSQNVLTNAIISKPTIDLWSESNDPYGVHKFGLTYVSPFLSVRSDSPTVAENIVASRLHTNVQEISDTSARVIAATEIPTGWFVYVGNVPYTMNPVVGFPITGITNAQVIGLYNMMLMEAYDWHPICLAVEYATANATKPATVNVVGDIHNLTTITADDLKNMHKVCVYSEFNAFSVG